MINIHKGPKVTRSTSAYGLPLFLPRPENSRQETPVQGKNNLSKAGSWEHLSDKPRNFFPCPVLTYHFFVPIGALEYTGISALLNNLHKKYIQRAKETYLISWNFNVSFQSISKNNIPFWICL